MGVLTTGQKTRAKRVRVHAAKGVLYRAPLSESEFGMQLALERHRAERSERAFALMLLNPSREQPFQAPNASEKLLAMLARSMRGTDVVGWHVQDAVPGVILTEFGNSELPSALKTVHARITALVQREWSKDCPSHLHITFHAFPAGPEAHSPSNHPDLIFYPELKRDRRLTLRSSAKRIVDLAGSVLGLILLFPVLAVVAVAVRLSSRGPAIYAQERVGKLGTPFVMYKFRTMCCDATSELHEEFVTRFIGGDGDASARIHKISDDPRVTRLGRFLRKTSLDELPQLFNVLRGEMSLVGPRPPLEYEVRRYQPWHRRRVFEAKPGMTGLWQVTSRSKSSFDEMVRLDLRYARRQSLWLDLLLVLRTTRVLISDDGAC